MEAMREAWTDGCLDDLNKKVEFDALQRTMVQVGGGVIVALIGLIATQL
jgi:hypothetical protein